MWFVWGLLLALGCVQARTRLDPLVDTDQGLIKGLKADDGEYSKFLGIPYAQVDSSNPFGASLPYPKFESTFEAYDDSFACPQTVIKGKFERSQHKYSLDCLRLNIYVPNEASSRNKLPVLVYIHGGGFTGGAGDIGPKYLVEHGLIIVSIHYRLGLYGFMCLNTPEVPGNQGLKDQYTALQWIHKNIGAFGGDTGQITVMGGSAGSISIDFHLLSNRPKLFNRAIMMSGSALSPEEVIPADRTVPLRVAATLGFETDNIEDALEFLAKADSDLVVGASSELSLYIRPCVENEFENVEPIISEHPEHSDISGTNNVVIMSGHSSHEELHSLFNKSEEFYRSLNLFHEYVNADFDFGDNLEMENIVRQFYIGDDEMSADLQWELINFASDFQFNYPNQRGLVRYLNNGVQNIYYYIFAYSSSSSEFQGVAAHGDERNYLFSQNSEVTSEDDHLAIARVTTMWANFVKHGDPTPDTTDLLPVKWAPMTKDVMNYMHLQTNLTLGNRPNHDRMAFWELFYKLNENKLRANHN